MDVIDYVEVYQYPELQPVTTLSGQIIVAVAVKFTKARLIDNITLTYRGQLSSVEVFQRWFVQPR